MHKKNFIFLTLLCLSTSASAASYYVSDNLHTFLHSGPAAKYKIIGSVNAGDKIKVLQKNPKYTKIVDPKGRTGWISSKYVSSQASLKERLPKLQIQLDDLKLQLNEDKKSIELYSNKIDKLEDLNSKLNDELKKVQALNSSLNEKLDTKKNDLLMQWFTYGGIVAGIGLVLGLIIPFLIPSRRKKTRW